MGDIVVGFTGEKVQTELATVNISCSRICIQIPTACQYTQILIRAPTYRVYNSIPCATHGNLFCTSPCRYGLKKDLIPSRCSKDDPMVSES